MSCVCRLLPLTIADGPHNMAADQVLLESAGAGVAALRFYGWSEATLSLGYFQGVKVCRQEEGLARLPFVRRPSGGGALVHHHELTYALALPAGQPWQGKESWLCRMHGIIMAALTRLGLKGLTCSGQEGPPAGVLCFLHLTPGDILLDQAKVVGSAQRRQRGAMMQHGGILLGTSPHTPELQGIQELAGLEVPAEIVAAEVAIEFAGQTCWILKASDWSAAEKQRIEELVRAKYGQDAWNCKR